MMATSRRSRIAGPPVVRYLRQAEEFQRRLEAGEARNRADLARQERLTRARITQLMELLKVHPLILDFVRHLKPGTPARLVTERKLRRLVRGTRDEQLVAADKSLVGFRAWKAFGRVVGVRGSDA